MKDEKDTTTCILNSTKWQPSVLQLLPFSKNNVGLKNKRSNGAFYQEHENGHSFPSLAVARSDQLRPRSKSANTASQEEFKWQESKQFGKGYPRKHLRASSEKNPRSSAFRDDSDSNIAAAHRHKSKLRARSEYGISSFSKRPEVVKISVNDINEQILGKSRIRSAVTNVDDCSTVVTCVSPDGRGLRPRHVEGDGSGMNGVGVEDVRGAGRADKSGVLKSSLKAGQGRWPNTGITFWSSATTGQHEVGYPRNQAKSRLGKSGRDIVGSDVSRSSHSVHANEHYLQGDEDRVMVNVNELPRSKTPIAEHDPDKLNMQHVIAFLQSSSSNKPENLGNKENDKHDAPTPSEAKSILPNSHKHHESSGKPSTINGIITTNAIKGNDVLLKTNLTKRKPNESFPTKKVHMYATDNGVELITPHRLKAVSKINNAHNDYNVKHTNVSHEVPPHSIAKSDNESIEVYRIKSRSSGSRTLNGLQLSDFDSHDITELRSKIGVTHLKSQPSRLGINDVHIPLNIRKIRNQHPEGDHRTFKLHRFLTLVPNGSNSLLNQPEKIDGSRSILDRGSAGLERSNASKPNRSKGSVRKGASADKRSRRHTHSRKAHRDDSVYYLDVPSPFDEVRPISGGSGVNRIAGNQENKPHHDTRRVIRLPRAHYEADSDEEGSPYSTVPAARNKRALTLSAQGRAIRKITPTRELINNSTNNSSNFVSTSTLHNIENTVIHQPQAPTELQNEQPSLELQNEPGFVRQNTNETPNGVQDANSKHMEPYAGHLHNSDKETTPVAEMAIGPPDVSAVTFKDMLDIRSETNSSPTYKQSPSPDRLKDPVNSAFITQLQKPALDNTPPEHSQSPEKNDQTPVSVSFGAATKLELHSPHSSTTRSPHSSSRDHVRLSLRKEKNRTREHTYMFQVGHEDTRPLS